MNPDATTIQRGLLSFIARKGGSIPMRELHTYSLVMYQAGHQAFSEVMEALVGAAYVTFNNTEATFYLTDKGRQLVDDVP
jgi:hypothetical protein